MSGLVFRDMEEAELARAWLDKNQARFDEWEASLPLAVREYLSREGAEPTPQIRRWAQPHIAEFHKHNNLLKEMVRVGKALTEYRDQLKPLLQQIERRSNVSMDRQQFYEQMSEPDAPDEMAFVLRRSATADSEMTFSREGMEAIAYQMHDYVLARTLGRWREHGLAPQGLRIEMRLNWDRPDNETLEEGDRPWYALDDRPEIGAGLTSPDGLIRLTAFFDDRKETP